MQGSWSQDICRDSGRWPIGRCLLDQPLSHPEGLGAKLVMQNALNDAGLKPEDVDYINVHGTSTPCGRYQRRSRR